MSRSLIRLCIATLVAMLFAVGVLYMVVRGTDQRERYRDTLAAFHLQGLPREAFSHSDLVAHLDALNREPCDKQAAWQLSRSLLAARYRREAATLLTTFSERCETPSSFLADAVQILRGLGDLTMAREMADRLVARDPSSEVALLVRGEVLNAQQDYVAASDDFERIIRESRAPAQLIGAVYAGAALARARRGEPCKAAELMATWIGYDPARRASPQAQAQRDEYRQSGNCTTTAAPTPQSYARRPNEVIRVRATINGRPGMFIVDTGASFVALTPAFARSAGVSTNTGRSVTLQTANGTHSAVLTRAETVAVGEMKTQDVQVVVKPGGEYGSGIDGLLGQSYLSRFQVTIHPDGWSIGLR